MRIKLLLMFKNEGRLLKNWIKYHTRLVGKENLVMFDNGSTCEETIDVIKWAKSHSFYIDMSQSSQNDFVNRGELFKDIINEKTYRYRADYYFPLDCDEFLAVENNSRVEISRSSLKSELKKYKGTTRALDVYAGLNADPTRHGEFIWSMQQQKRFFTPGNCFWLDEGFHYGLGMCGDEPIPTKIVYIHYHFKPYNLVQSSARTKLAPYLSDFSEQALREYVKLEKPAYHCAVHLLKSHQEYLDQFKSKQAEAFPEIDAAFRRVGERLPYDERANFDGSKSGFWRSITERFKL